jgi:hypothetical protein
MADCTAAANVRLDFEADVWYFIWEKRPIKTFDTRLAVPLLGQTTFKDHQKQYGLRSSNFYLYVVDRT